MREAVVVIRESLNESESKIIDISISFDGTWHGVGIVIDLTTDCVRL